MTDMQTSLPLLIVRPSILNPVINFSTHLWPVKWKCPRLYLCLAHSILSPPILMQHMHQPITKWYDPFHIITWSYWFIDLDFTCSSSLHRSIGAKSCSSFTVTRGLASKPPTCPSYLQPIRRAKWCLDLLHHDHMTQCHVSYAMSPPSSHVQAFQHLQAISTFMAYVAHTHVPVD
jgi:hypothetical protein